ncbi:cardiolipin synthase [Pseudodesulfovibrio sp. zrk46]|uniref:cardiolipin synthase n=1 Tax=Pseudodesulfovibrio sp. zrk46 TaxID=2725288 RepID=UPI001449ACD0|nr:cardiolipin synthase [Pseudodesulfovibrio sp. zrk46]QJB57872.1 cardiolipin synthase [Pseudodesulfovibrio sp. zrk46]
MLTEDVHFLITAFSLFYTVVEITAIITAIIAVRDTRTPQGAVAWAISLVTFPLLTLPFYWVFGRSKFHGYVDAMRAGEERFLELVEDKHNIPQVPRLSERKRPHTPRAAFETLAEIPFLKGNDLELHINGHDTFDAIFSYINQAKKYVLIQFFIVHDDELGKRLQKLLVRKAREGVRINFLYDEIGCHKTPPSYWNTMRKAGVDVHPFHTRRGRGNRFQLNFRNHRKIVVIDGQTAFVGGHNIGNEYLGVSDKFDGWRDTHMRITGPAVIGVRISFAKDWFWATGELYEIDLSLPEPSGNADVLALATGPADDLESCSLMFIRAINSAQKRFWIASPYFVPDSSVCKALQLAAMRGVDVRILLPRKPDHLLVYLAGFACLKELKMPGIRVFRYNEGFLHQKVFLADDKLAGVGTANLDNRSFRLNFEITMLVEDIPFCNQIEQMFQVDFTNSVETGTQEYHNKNVVYQTVIKFARLLSPIL